MADVTTHFGFPFPEDTDPADGPVGIQNLAQAVEDELLVRSHGKSIIAAEQIRNVNSYALLGTPDRVQDLVLPEGGLIVVVFHALVKGSPPASGKVALFLGANQLKVIKTSAAAPVVQEAETASSTSNYSHIMSCPAGLVLAAAQSGTDASKVTTGLLIGATDDPALTSFPDVLVGGAALIEAAAGTYDLSVQFKSTGTITAKERTLRAWTLGP